jgi:hypothetical protein
MRETDDLGNKWWALDATASREERVSRSRDAFVHGGLRGAGAVGALGIVSHIVATLRCA